MAGTLDRRKIVQFFQAKNGSINTCSIVPFRTMLWEALGGGAPRGRSGWGTGKRVSQPNERDTTRGGGVAAEELRKRWRWRPWWITGGSIMREAQNRSQQMRLLSLSSLSKGGGQRPLSSAAAAATAVAVAAAEAEWLQRRWCGVKKMVVAFTQFWCSAR